MNTIETLFVPYELAVKLKALGFDEPCFGGFVKVTDTQTTFFMNDVISDIDRETPLHESLIIKAPLYQQAFRWFREKYGLFHSTNHQDDNSGPGCFDYEILDKRGKPPVEDDGSEFKTYEEAELACLTKLISIVEQQKQK